jgi:cytoskeletal protein CcmA (bactofilin family)
MWTSKPQPVPPEPSPRPSAKIPPVAAGAAIPAPPPAVKASARLGPGIMIKGEISGHEDLHVDGLVEGPISLGGYRLTVGRPGRVDADVVAREVVVYGELHGEFRVRDRMEIKKDSSVVGEVSTARIVIEEGAYFHGSVDIDRSNTRVGADLDTLLARGESKAE